jgi:hypothetical protein
MIRRNGFTMPVTGARQRASSSCPGENSFRSAKQISVAGARILSALNDLNGLNVLNRFFVSLLGNKRAQNHANKA